MGKMNNFKGGRDDEQIEITDANTPSLIFKVSLDCGHVVFTPIVLRLQYPDDSHYILCPFCKDDKCIYGRVPTAWQNVTGIEELYEHEFVRNVYGESAFIVSRDILRLQPSVPSNRTRPFPYVPSRRNFRIS
jgi:hypothetical protein